MNFLWSVISVLLEILKKDNLYYECLLEWEIGE